MFTQRLKQLRSEKELSQAKLAEMLNMSQQAVAKWETKKATPDPATLIVLAGYFDVSVDYLLGNSNKRHLDENYHLSPEIIACAKQISERPELKSLFDVAVKAKKQDVESLIDTLQRFK